MKVWWMYDMTSLRLGCEYSPRRTKVSATSIRFSISFVLYLLLEPQGDTMATERLATLPGGVEHWRLTSSEKRWYFTTSTSIM